ncbi:PRLR isoform 17 [Pan troglodytes]|uniref:Prolactin receptor n=3 Tax=Hominidae TaxID=9604 RepID=D6R9E1_HUMAN|nr:PRLR isoform 15 [Pan troglodytes]PNI25700.1 PRLR isoform 17 [Pan troglodytes]PNJ66961.1 PRLR isoform 7 [Pongo abelii]PNJ66962.1 PRLR isoform 8 [Pongo abelii]
MKENVASATVFTLLLFLNTCLLNERHSCMNVQTT